jgi:replication factor C subunit 2/4
MRQAINNLQSTYYGFKFINAENVYKVCDQPHPNMVRSIIQCCLSSDLNSALVMLQTLDSMGYSAIDIISTFFKVVKGFNDVPEEVLLNYIKVLRFKISYSRKLVLSI